jgi:hypothetical protein
MKKRILGIIIVAAIALAAGWNITQNEDEISLTDLALINIEALAEREDKGKGKNECYNTITDDPAGRIRYCGECEFVRGKGVSGKGFC